MPPSIKSKQHRAQWRRYKVQARENARAEAARVAPSGAAISDPRLDFVFPVYVYRQLKSMLR